MKPSQKSAPALQALAAMTDLVREALANRTDPDWKVLANARKALSTASASAAPMAADIEQILWKGQADGKTRSEIAEEILREFETPSASASPQDSTSYVERSKVREILIGQPDENLHVTEDILREVDGLTIFTAADFQPSAGPQAEAVQPRVTDNDNGEISVTFNGKELRGFIYRDDTTRRLKMLAAREYIEGWCDGRDAQ